MTGKAGDWLIIGIEGEQYPCADRIFRKTYEVEKNDGPELDPGRLGKVEAKLALRTKESEILWEMLNEMGLGHSAIRETINSRMQEKPKTSETLCP